MNPLRHFGIQTDNDSYNAKIQTPEKIRPGAGKWIECPTCHGMPTQTYYRPCRKCKDWGIIKK